MQFALQALSQIPQALQLDLSIAILKKENLEKIPSKVPTGHIVLQYNLPYLNDKKNTTAKNAIA